MIQSKDERVRELFDFCARFYRLFCVLISQYCTTLLSTVIHVSYTGTVKLCKKYDFLLNTSFFMSSRPTVYTEAKHKNLRMNLVMYSNQNISTPFIFRPKSKSNVITISDLRQAIVNHVLNKFKKRYKLNKKTLHFFLENGDLLSTEGLNENETIDSIECLYNDCNIYICTKAEIFTLPKQQEKKQQKPQKIAVKPLELSSVRHVIGKQFKHLGCIRNVVDLSHAILITPTKKS